VNGESSGLRNFERVRSICSNNQESPVDLRREKVSAVNGGCSFSVLGRERSYADGCLGVCGGVGICAGRTGFGKLGFKIAYSANRNNCQFVHI